MRALRYAFDEALMSLWRGRQAGLLAISTIAVAVFVLGAFLIVTANLRRLSAEWGAAAEVSVYLKDGISASERAAVEEVLKPGDLITAREFVSKDEALKRFKQTFGELASAVDSVGGNPLPVSYEVRLRDTADAAQRVEVLVAQLKGLAGVTDVQYDRQWLNRLLVGVGAIRTVGFLLAVILTIAAALSVANVVRLALYARRDEIDIMQLVGAPQLYIRGPFVLEGVLQGGIGAALALVALAVGFVAVRARYLSPLASTLDVSSIGFLPLGLCLLLVVGGMAVGCVGGSVAARSR